MAAITTTDAVSETVTVVNRRGLHARASAKFARLATQFQAQISVARQDIEVPGRSLMGLLTLGASMDKEITITATGPDAPQALAALTDLIARGFDEDDSDCC